MRSLRDLVEDGLVLFAVLAATLAVHFLWTTRLPETTATQSAWAALPADEHPRFARYLEEGGYWLGYSYGLSLAFAVAALRRFIRSRTTAAGGYALGGFTFSGLLVVGGCYLLGCCGSPMLAIYLNLFGAGFLPFAKPFLAALTTLSILGTWWWMTRSDRTGSGCCPTPSCDCR